MLFLVIIVAVLLAQLADNALDWHVAALNPLSTGLVAGDIFLNGVLLCGILTYDKGGEWLAGRAGTIADERRIQFRGTGAGSARHRLERRRAREMQGQSTERWAPGA